MFMQDTNEMLRCLGFADCFDTASSKHRRTPDIQENAWRTECPVRVFGRCPVGSIMMQTSTCHPHSSGARPASRPGLRRGYGDLWPTPRLWRTRWGERPEAVCRKKRQRGKLREERKRGSIGRGARGVGITEKLRTLNTRILRLSDEVEGHNAGSHKRKERLHDLDGRRREDGWFVKYGARPGWTKDMPAWAICGDRGSSYLDEG